jgi:hypothetical protein
MVDKKIVSGRVVVTSNDRVVVTRKPFIVIKKG